jgi:hypothetical protein
MKNTEPLYWSSVASSGLSGLDLSTPPLALPGRSAVLAS